ncbi:MAG TPA: TonB family protein [Pyrinomonadaceae bacterium]|nr:TonB family protein [Pyrinomonadaceae bacterium]
MKPVLLCIALLLSAFIPQSPEESPELKEATTLTESVVKLSREGKLDEALPLAKRALEIREKLLPRTDPRLALSMSYLADLYRAKRDFGAAKNVLQRLLQIQEEQSDAGVSRTLERLAWIDLSDGDAGKAEDHYKRALELKEKAFGPDNVQVAETLVGLGAVYRVRSDFKSGAPIFKRALTIYARHSGVNSPVFQQTAEGFTCLAHETLNRDAEKDLDEIWRRFAAPGSPAESPYITVNGKALSLPKPSYGEEARRRQLSGFVVLKVTIDEQGRVISARDMCQGSPFLSPGALESARNAKFAPFMVNNQAVKFDGVITYRFAFR